MSYSTYSYQPKEERDEYYLGSAWAEEYDCGDDHHAMRQNIILLMAAMNNEL